MANDDLGRTLRRLRRLASLTQEELADRSGVSVDAIRQLEQGRKHSARLPTLHALANGLGVELTTLLGDPPAVSSGENDGPRFVAMRRAVMPVLWGPDPAPPTADFSLDRLREQIADGWTQYHSAEFDTVMKALPDLISDARTATASADEDEGKAGFAVLAKALQLAGHVAVRMGKTDLALTSLERAIGAAGQSGDPLLVPMIVNSVAWTYQRQGRLDDALSIAVRAAADIAHMGHTDTADGLKVWGALTMSAATSAARSGDYERAAAMMETAENEAARVSKLPEGRGPSPHRHRRRDRRGQDPGVPAPGRPHMDAAPHPGRGHRPRPLVPPQSPTGTGLVGGVPGRPRITWRSGTQRPCQHSRRGIVTDVRGGSMWVFRPEFGTG